MSKLSLKNIFYIKKTKKYIIEPNTRSTADPMICNPDGRVGMRDSRIQGRPIVNGLSGRPNRYARSGNTKHS
ncbi:unnamed protein product, partial [Trichogramma brassicae]